MWALTHDPESQYWRKAGLVWAPSTSVVADRAQGKHRKNHREILRVSFVALDHYRCRCTLIVTKLTVAKIACLATSTKYGASSALFACSKHATTHPMPTT